jgi:hypothetical protein
MNQEPPAAKRAAYDAACGAVRQALWHPFLADVSADPVRDMPTFLAACKVLRRDHARALQALSELVKATPTDKTETRDRLARERAMLANKAGEYERRIVTMEARWRAACAAVEKPSPRSSRRRWWSS